MTRNVVWRKLAENRLAELWAKGYDRKAITAAANAIDDLLAREGPNCGESRPRGTRILFEAPLGVLFKADTAKPPTSLRVELGHEVLRAPLLAAILLELEHGYDAWLGVS